MKRLAPFLLATSLQLIAQAKDNAAITFWSEYDARKAPLNIEVVEEWEDEAGSFQLVRYDLGPLEGTNRSASPRIAAYYGHPQNAGKVPGILHIHGGGQRASKSRVADWVKLGYACISINWGGKVLEQEDTPNTDWDGLAAGFVRVGVTDDDLTHHNTVRPDTHTLYKEPHLLNSSWNLIAMSGRRALTFLEQQSVVDGEKLGVEGHSMGGRSTVLTAIDPRIRAASPSVGGSGYLYRDMWGLPGSARQMTREDGLALYEQAVSCQSYWPHIQAPVLFLQATNDFNAPTDLVDRAMALLPDSTERTWACAPHLNHRFTTETQAARFMWMEAHLKGSFVFPKQSPSRLNLETDRSVPRFEVNVDRSSGLPVEKVEIFYGYARDPRIRFWRSAKVDREGDRYFAECPLFDVNEPLFAFANITYEMPDELPARPGAAATRSLTVSSQYQAVYPETLKTSQLKATETRRRLIDDFSGGWQDWYRLSEENPHHWFYGTRKIIDPSWMGPEGARLAVEIHTTQAGNRIAIGIEANTWQGYTGKTRDTFHAIVRLEKAGVNSLELAPSDFTNADGEPMADWDEATELTFTPANRVAANTHPENWEGSSPVLANLRWVGGDLSVNRPHPHEERATRRVAKPSFHDEFQKAIDDSVKLEKADKKAADGK